MSDVKIFAGSYMNAFMKPLSEHIKVISKRLNYTKGNSSDGKSHFTIGEVDVDRFSDGEMCPRFMESVRGVDVFIVQSTYGTSDTLLELLLLVDGAKRASATTINVAIPYFGYARQDRKDRPRVPIAAKLMANLLQAAGASRVITMDLHADQIQGFFDIPVDHLDARIIFGPYLKSLSLGNLMFASPDVGGTKRTRNFAKMFDAPMVIIDKQRKRANEVESMQVIGDVKGYNVVLIDDLVDTGGTLARAANLIMEQGALSVRAVCTHPVLSGNGYENIAGSTLTELITTDTIPLKKELKKVKVLSSAPLFADAFKLIHYNESVSELFQME